MDKILLGLVFLLSMFPQISIADISVPYFRCEIEKVENENGVKKYKEITIWGPSKIGPYKFKVTFSWTSPK